MNENTNYDSRFCNLTGCNIAQTTIDSEDWKQAESFTTQMWSSIKYYSVTRKTNPEKAREDIFNGKIAEIGTQNIFEHFGIVTKPLDYEIRQGAKKGWIPDIETIEGNQRIHVKTCTLVPKSEKENQVVSWVFSKTDSDAGTDLLFKNGDENDWLAFTCVYCGRVILLSLLNWNQCAEIFQPPYVEKLKPIKTCIYYKKILETYPDSKRGEMAKISGQ